MPIFRKKSMRDPKKTQVSKDQAEEEGQVEGWGGVRWGGGRRRGEYGAAALAEGTVHSWHPKGLFSAHSFLVCSLSLLSSRCSPIVVV